MKIKSRVDNNYPKFLSVTKCPKCKGCTSNVKREYVKFDADVKADGLFFTTYNLVYYPERMRGTCESCGYSWFEHTADYVEESWDSSDE